MAYENERNKMINELAKHKVWSFEELCIKETRELENLLKIVDLVTDACAETIREAINEEKGLLI